MIVPSNYDGLKLDEDTNVTKEWCIELMDYLSK